MQNLPYTSSSKFLINKIIKKLLDSNAIQILKSPRHLYVCSPQWSSPHPFVICDFILFFGGQTLQNFNLKIKNRIFCHEFNFFGKNICQIFENKKFPWRKFDHFWDTVFSFLTVFHQFSSNILKKSSQQLSNAKSFLAWLWMMLHKVLFFNLWCKMWCKIAPKPKPIHCKRVSGIEEFSLLSNLWEIWEAPKTLQQTKISVLSSYQKQEQSPTVIKVVLKIHDRNPQKSNTWFWYITMILKKLKPPTLHWFFCKNHQFFEVFEIIKTHQFFDSESFQRIRTDGSPILKHLKEENR